MAIPKKRKKLDESVEAKIITEAEEIPREKILKAKKTSKTKVDSAFDMIDKVEKNITDKTIQLKKVDAIVPFNPNEGIHIKFKIDAINWQNLLEGKNPINEQEGILVDFTIPYPWNLPVIGDITKTILREFSKFRIF